MPTAKAKNTLYTFVFKSSEKLTLAINCLYHERSTRFLNSSLFLMNNKYYLCIIARNNKGIEKILEFCDNYSKNSIYSAILTEHAKLLAKNNAIFNFGKAFAKYF